VARLRHLTELNRMGYTASRTLPGNSQYNYGYAITAHRSQGKTVDEVIISGDHMTRELFYVAASRGRNRITVFTGDKESLRESIGLSGQRMSALELLRKQARTEDRTRFAERSAYVGRKTQQGSGKGLVEHSPDRFRARVRT